MTQRLLKEFRTHTGKEGENPSLISYYQAKILIAIGPYSKLISDIVCTTGFHRTRIYDNLLMLAGKGLARESEFGWTSCLLTDELNKLREEVEEYEKNIQSNGNDTGNTGGL